jgi:hypothetical protein
MARTGAGRKSGDPGNPPKVADDLVLGRGQFLGGGGHRLDVHGRLAGGDRHRLRLAPGLFGGGRHGLTGRLHLGGGG